MNFYGVKSRNGEPVENEEVYPRKFILFRHTDIVGQYTHEQHTGIIALGIEVEQGNTCYLYWPTTNSYSVFPYTIFVERTHCYSGLTKLCYTDWTCEAAVDALILPQLSRYLDILGRRHVPIFMTDEMALTANILARGLKHLGLVLYWDENDHFYAIKSLSMQQVTGSSTA